MAYALGGRASEELVFGKVSTGALSDLEKITKQAYAMVSYFGMSDKIGNISFYDSSGQTDFNFTKPYSERTAELIDQEVKQIVEESYARAKSVLKQNLKGLTELAELLLEKEVIFSEDLERIFGKRKADILKEMREAEEKKTQSAEAAKTKTENDPAEQLSTTEDAPQKEQSKNTTKQEKLFPDTNTVDSEEQAKQSTE